MRSASYGQTKLFTLGWEENHDVRGTMEMLKENWYIPFLSVILFYLPVVFIGPRIMEKRQPIKLKLTLMIWNASLAIFSTLGFIHTLPEIIHSLKTYGFYHSICRNSFLYYPSATYWHYLFAMSKTPELVDTLFLVLRKQNLMLLHTYHHGAVVVVTWFNHAYGYSGLRWYNTMNYGIHCIMYTYFALKCIPEIIRIPKQVSMLITFLQTIQMAMGLYVVLANSYHMSFGSGCDTNWPLAIYAFLFYGVLLFLFSKYFYDAYLSSTPLKDRSPAVEKKRD